MRSAQQLIRSSDHQINMKATIALVLAVLSLAYAQEQTTPVGICSGSTKPQYNSVRLTSKRGVCTEQPCKLSQGETVELLIKVTADRSISEIHQKVVATVLGITTNFPIDDANKGCNNVQNSVCPFTKDEDIEFLLKLKLPSILPQVHFDLVFTLSNEIEEVFSCFTIGGDVDNS